MGSHEQEILNAQDSNASIRHICMGKFTRVMHGAAKTIRSVNNRNMYFKPYKYFNLSLNQNDKELNSHFYYHCSVKENII